eukprot:g1419.t1
MADNRGQQQLANALQQLQIQALQQQVLKLQGDADKAASKSKMDMRELRAEMKEKLLEARLEAHMKEVKAELARAQLKMQLKLKAELEKAAMLQQIKDLAQRPNAFPAQQQVFRTVQQRGAIRQTYDNRAEDLTKEGMRQGILDSGAFLVFLSAGILARPFCQFELREAIAHKKIIVLIRESQRYESDPR